MIKTKKSPKKTKENQTKKNAFGGVFGFRWLKKSLAGKNRNESMDLLDQWILKKRTMSLFF